MAQVNINEGDTGLQARTAINDNFTEVYTAIGAFGGSNFLTPVAGDNTSNINSAIATLGDEKVLRLLPGGTYNINGTVGITLVDGLTIEGNGATIGYHSGGGYVFDLVTNIEVTFKDLTVQHSQILNQSDGTLNLENVTFKYYSAEGDAAFQTSGGNIYARNWNLDGIASSTQINNDIMQVKGGVWSLDELDFTGTGEYDMTLDRLVYYGSSTAGRVNFGLTNSYDMITENANWLAHNAANAMTVRLTCYLVTDLFMISRGDSKVTLMNGNYLRGYWNVYDNGYLKAYNCTGTAGNVLGESNGTLEVDHCYMRKDLGKSLVPYPGDIYNEANWGTEGLFADHIFETFGASINAYNYYPLYIIRNCVLEYMGDDVLNSLQDTELLAELEANATYTVDGTGTPTTPTVAGAWAASTAYTAGQILWSPNNWRGGKAQKFALIVIENHTSSSDVQDDIYDGKLRVLFGANRQANGKYQQMIYLQTAGWYSTISPTLTYSGGQKRNRGNGMNIVANAIIENTKIIDHACVYSTRMNVAQSVNYDNTGALAYPQFSITPITFCIVANVDIEFRGNYNNQYKAGINITEPLGLENGEFTFSDIRAIGEGLHSVIKLGAWTNDFENKFKIGPLYRQHGDIADASYWPNRYNSENFICGSYNSIPVGYTFNEWVNYLCDFKNEVRDENTYPIVP